MRDRPGDISLLADYFIQEYNREFHKQITGVEPTAMAIMQTHSWPGNVRELRNVLERAMLLAGGGRLTLADLPAEIRQPPARNGTGEVYPPWRGESVIRLGPEGIDLKLVERQLVQQALKRTGGNQTRAAALLNMTRDQLRYRVQKFGLKPQGD